MQEMQETQAQSLGRKDPRRRKWQLTSVFLPGKSHTGYSPWGRKESDMTERARACARAPSPPPPHFTM